MKDKKQLYALRHIHRFGMDIFLFKAEQKFNPVYNDVDIQDIMFLLNKLGIYYEVNRGESVEINPIDKPIILK